MPRHLITLLTDFGHTDAYAGVLKGVILDIDPSATIVDLTHDVPPQDILQGAFLLGTAWQEFPVGTIHIAVVDPEVGTDRSALLVQGGGHTFLAPDNGLLSFAIPNEATQGRNFEIYDRPVPKGYTARALTNPEYWRHPVSPTFHARDIFGPVAAHLSSGTRVDNLGKEVSTLKQLHIQKSRWDQNMLTGWVVHIDRFGNIVTTIPANLISQAASTRTSIGGTEIMGMSTTYGTAKGLIALIGSHGYLEIATQGGSAAKLLRIMIGDEVLVLRNQP